MAMKAFDVLIRGLAMGAADVVPGVSGGTVALLTGIYQRLLDAIHAIGPQAVVAWKNHGAKAAWKTIDGPFLLTLFAGIGLSIVSLSKLVVWGLDQHPMLVWSGFFGLVLASLPLIWRKVKQPTLAHRICLYAGIAIGAGLTFISPASQELTATLAFSSGFIAICAMILPGISGSFILILLGVYESILTAIHDRDLLLIASFSAGALAGLLSFARFLRWCFQQAPNVMLSLMTGFIAGSLIKVYPYHGLDSNLPLWPNHADFDSMSWEQHAGVFVAALVGIGIVALLNSQTKQQ
ncbi:MAG: DUF368 domain-containing protein [Bacteroidetes bacterium]|nr:DUF368 domain-containing protein [Bacteroidota bacterium]